MDMPCLECGGKSPMGSIFCRDCGAKLDVDAMEPTVKVSSNERSFKITKFAIRRLISLVVLVFLSIFVWLLISDESPAPQEPIADNSLKGFNFVYETAFLSDEYYQKTKLRTWAVKETELAGFLNQNIALINEGGEGTIKPLYCVVDFYGGNMIKIDMKVEANVFGVTKNMSLQMLFSFINGEDGVIFSIEKTKHGKLPIPSFARKQLVTSRFENLIESGADINAMLGKIKSLEIKEDVLIVVLKDIVKAVPEKK